MMEYAVITQVLTNQVKIKLNSSNVESSIPYYYLSSYTPSVGDVVLCDTALRCIIGKVVL